MNEPDAPHWPYPPAFFAWFVLSDRAAGLTGLRYDGFVQIAPILADAALAWIVQAFLGSRGAPERVRLAAAALVALGPSFGFVSGYHGQIDAVSILPAVLGLWLWSRSEAPQRALVAGLLIGLGGAVKIGALLTVLALLPSARSWGERARLVAAAGCVPLLLLVPWLAADPDGTAQALGSNDGLPGFGGISLLVQPELSALWLQTKQVELTALSETLFDRAAVIAIGALLATGVVLLARRVPPLEAAVVVWLCVYALGVNFSLQYLVWGLPFFLMAGRLRAVAALQAAVLVPTALIYGVGARSEPLHRIYTPIMLAVWAAFVAWYVLELRRAAAGPSGRQGLTATRPV